MAGRPSGIALDPSQESNIGEEACILDSRGRLPIPSWLAASASLSTGTGKNMFIALGVFREPGLIVLLPWDSQSPAVLDRYRVVLAEGDFNKVIAFEHRYRRIQIPKDLRPTLGTSAFAHLGLNADISSVVYVASDGASILVMSQAFKERQIAAAENSGLFDGLP